HHEPEHRERDDAADHLGEADRRDPEERRPTVARLRRDLDTLLLVGLLLDVVDLEELVRPRERADEEEAADRGDDEPERRDVPVDRDPGEQEQDPESEAPRPEAQPRAWLFTARSQVSLAAAASRRPRSTMTDRSAACIGDPELAPAGRDACADLLAHLD